MPNELTFVHRLKPAGGHIKGLSNRLMIEIIPSGTVCDAAHLRRSFLAATWLAAAFVRHADRLSDSAEPRGVS